MKGLRWILMLLVLGAGTAYSQAPVKKMRLAVMDMETAGVSQDTGSIVSDLLRTELFKTGLFELVERGQIQQVLSEQQMQLSGVTGDAYSVKLGELLSADKVLVGKVGKLGNAYIINARIIDVERGIMEFGESTEVPSESQLSTGCRDFARKLAGLITGDTPIDKQPDSVTPDNQPAQDKTDKPVSKDIPRYKHFLAVSYNLAQAGWSMNNFAVEAKLAPRFSLLFQGTGYNWSSDEFIPLYEAGFFQPAVFFRYYLLPGKVHALTGWYIEAGAGPRIWWWDDVMNPVNSFDGSAFTLGAHTGYQMAFGYRLGLLLNFWVGYQEVMDDDYWNVPPFYDEIPMLSFGLNIGIVL